MRADRLLSELLIMQRRGHVTADELAGELEVSVRTIYRDWYGLRVAGVPLITNTGPGGGARLYGDWRTELSGLTAAEFESLALLAAMGPTKPAGKRLTTALAKLSAALPDERRLPAGRVHFDLGSGDSFLEGLNHAVHMDLCVDIELTRAFDTRITHRAHPLGLVSHDESWHLVWTQADGRIRVDPTGAMSSVRVTRARFDRPADFDLARFWTEHLSTLAASRRNFVASLRATDQVIPLLQRRFGEDLSRVGQELEVRFDGVIEARSALLPWGGAIEVVAPEALRRTMGDHATQTLARYGVEDGIEGGQ